MNELNIKKINIFNCPVCNNNHETLSKYSRVVCDTCINMFGMTNCKGDKLEIILDDDSPFFTKVQNCYSKNKECYINGYPCYIILSENLDTYQIVCTMYIPFIRDEYPKGYGNTKFPNKIPNIPNIPNKRILRNKCNNTYNEIDSFKEIVDTSKNKIKHSLIFSFFL